MELGRAGSLKLEALRFIKSSVQNSSPGTKLELKEEQSIFYRVLSLLCEVARWVIFIFFEVCNVPSVVSFVEVMGVCEKVYLSQSVVALEKRLVISVVFHIFSWCVWYAAADLKSTYCTAAPVLFWHWHRNHWRCIVLVEVPIVKLVLSLRCRNHGRWAIL